jgi:hypothetical protein
MFEHVQREVALCSPYVQQAVVNPDMQQLCICSRIGTHNLPLTVADAVAMTSAADAGELRLVGCGLTFWKKKPVRWAPPEALPDSMVGSFSVSYALSAVSVGIGRGPAAEMLAAANQLSEKVHTAVADEASEAGEQLISAFNAGDGCALVVRALLKEWFAAIRLEVQAAV